MRIIRYQRLAQSAEHLPAPEAVKLVAELLYGPEWTENLGKALWPTLKKSGGQFYRRRLISDRGRIKVDEINVGAGKRTRKGYALYSRSAKALIGRLLDGGITAVAEPVGGRSVKIDSSYAGVIRRQVNTLLTTGYMELTLQGRKNFALIVFDRTSVLRIFGAPKAPDPPPDLPPSNSPSNAADRVPNPIETLSDVSGGSPHAMPAQAVQDLEQFALDFLSWSETSGMNRPCLTKEELVDRKQRILSELPAGDRSAWGRYISNADFRKAVLKVFRKNDLARSGTGGKRQANRPGKEALDKFLQHRLQSRTDKTDLRKP